jgi:hypothetical protein
MLKEAHALASLKQLMSRLSAQVTEVEMTVDAGEDPTDAVKELYRIWGGIHKPANSLRLDK